MTSFIDQHSAELDQRYHTMKKALDLLEERGGKVIVETGCVRLANDWGAGMSTIIFADWCSRTSGKLISIDNSRQNLETARNLAGILANRIIFIEFDSAKYLENIGTPIDLLYLDSWDYPYVEMLVRHGYSTEQIKAVGELWAMTDDDVIVRHGDLVLPCQQHCRSELVAAWDSLHDKSIVLIDDANFPGGGKARLARIELCHAGWKELSGPKSQQSLWVKE